MKKYLAILGLFLFLSAPAFAICPCSTSQVYMPRVQAVAVPIVEPCTTCNTCLTGAACPIIAPCTTCNTCLTGAACPIVEPCNTCHPFVKGVAYPVFYNNYY